MTQPRTTGFSLVELSIVLVILGLLTGGILAGQSLIRASELRAVSSEHQRYQTAINSFRDKYFGNPGDFRDATRFWGRQVGAAHCVTNSSAAVNAAGGCDGTGDGRLDSPPAASQAGEFPQFWRHLALAGLIEGTYSGLAGAGGVTDCVIGTDCPRSKLSNAGWAVQYVANFAGDASAYTFDYQNFFYYGAAISGNVPANPALKAEEAWNLDTKMDDGRPAQGKIMARYWNNACATGGATFADLANSTYNLSNSAVSCALMLPKIF